MRQHQLYTQRLRSPYPCVVDCMSSSASQATVRPHKRDKLLDNTSPVVESWTFAFDTFEETVP